MAKCDKRKNFRNRLFLASEKHSLRTERSWSFMLEKLTSDITMIQPDLISLPVSGVQLLVLDKPKVLETDPTWLLVLCQLCSDKRLMQLRWNRDGGRRFPVLFNTLKLREKLEVSGDFVMHAFVEDGVLVCNRSIIATSVKIYSPNQVLNDGCEIPITTVEEVKTGKDIEFCIKYLRTKIELDSLTERVKGMQISNESTTGLPATGKSSRKEKVVARNIESRVNELFTNQSMNQRGTGWVHRSNNTRAPAPLKGKCL